MMIAKTQTRKTLQGSSSLSSKEDLGPFGLGSGDRYSPFDMRIRQSGDRSYPARSSEYDVASERRKTHLRSYTIWDSLS